MSKYRFHHLGIPTEEKKDGEELHEMLGFKFYATPFGANPYGVQWHRFPENHGFPEIVTKVPHLAFQVDDLDQALEGKKILFGPHEPIDGYRCAMIEDDGLPVEFVETRLSNEELEKLDS